VNHSTNDYLPVNIQLAMENGPFIDGDFPKMAICRDKPWIPFGKLNIAIEHGHRNS